MNGEVAQTQSHAAVSCAGSLSLTAVSALPRVEPGDDLGALLAAALRTQGLTLAEHDVLVVTSKVVSKAEDRYVDLASVTPSRQAIALAQETGKDPRLVEVILWESEQVSRKAADVLIVRHRGGHVSANAGIDQSNARPKRATAGTGPWILRLPADPDASARKLRDQLQAAFGARVGVVISDSFGRPFRAGTVGQAIGLAGFPALFDQRGRRDLDGRILEATITAPADQLAAVCDLVAGQADEGRAAVHVRGLRFATQDVAAGNVCRPVKGDLYL